MNVSQVSVQGTLRTDGTLHLNEAPGLPPGPVEVVIRALPVPQESKETWWEYLQRARAELLAQGGILRSKEAIDADRACEQELDAVRDRAIDAARVRG